MPMLNKRKRIIWHFVFIGLLVILFLANLWYGSVFISWDEVWKALFGSEHGSTYSVIVNEYRLPQAITAMITGMALGVTGLLLQTLFRNPLAGPSVLGISSGASFGVAIALLAGGAFGSNFFSASGFYSEIFLIFSALAGAVIVLLAILYASNHIGNIVTVLIIGIMIGYAVSALVGVLQFFSRAEELHAYVLWGLGSFSKTNLSQSLLLLIVGLVGILASFTIMKPLNAILLGDKYAKSVGVNTKRLQTIVIAVSGFLIAISTAFTGPIAFVGLAVPHLARNFFQTSNHRILLPAAIWMGGVLTLLCNLIAKLPGYDTSLPINAVTSFIGAPIVIWVIAKRGRIKK
jgi:iron complex transport system permease protein